VLAVLASSWFNFRTLGLSLDARAGDAVMIPPLAGTYLFFQLIYLVVTTPICWLAAAVLGATLLARAGVEAAGEDPPRRSAHPSD
jgi:hypothetical protein